MSSSSTPRSLCSFGVFLGILLICFAKPLFQLAQFAIKSTLYSHVVLIPFISAYFIRQQWKERRIIKTGRSLSGVLPFALGAGLLLLMFFAKGALSRADSLSILTAAFVLWLVAGGLFFLGSERMRSIAFPVGMLFFMVPFPSAVEKWIEIFFQHTSAGAAAGLFALTNTPVYRDGLLFNLPGISIRVAEECSGIHSSLVLFITGLIAGQLFLRSPFTRAFLALVVVPLGIIRNGFRIFTIGMLCVHVSPSMMDSPIHHRGGPIFFALSLIPFFLILIWLRRRENSRARDLIGQTIKPAIQI